VRASACGRPILLTGIAAKPAPADVTDMLWPGDPRRRLLASSSFCRWCCRAYGSRHGGESGVALGDRRHDTSAVVLLSSPRIVIPRAQRSAFSLSRYSFRALAVWSRRLSRW